MQYKPIKDIVDQVGISKTAIYNKLNNYSSFYEQYIKVVDGEKRINKEGIQALKDNAHQKQKQKKTESITEQGSSEVERLLNIIDELTESLKREQALHMDTKQELKLLKSGNENTDTTEEQQIIITDPTEKQELTEEEQPKSKWSRIMRIIREQTTIQNHSTWMLERPGRYIK